MYVNFALQCCDACHTWINARKLHLSANLFARTDSYAVYEGFRELRGAHRPCRSAACAKAGTWARMMNIDNRSVTSDPWRLHTYSETSPQGSSRRSWLAARESRYVGAFRQIPEDGSNRCAHRHSHGDPSSSPTTCRSWRNSDGFHDGSSIERPQYRSCNRHTNV